MSCCQQQAPPPCDAAKMSPRIIIGPEPVLAVHAPSPPAAGSHCPAKISAPGGKSRSKRSVCRNLAGGRFSAPRGETLLLLPPRPSQTYTRARGQEGPLGIGSGCEIHSARGDDTTQLYCIKQEYRRAQGFCPWSPSQEGARDQSSSARRGLPSKGEARALHHQPAPASTLTMSCLCSTLILATRQVAKSPRPYRKPKLTKLRRNAKIPKK
jgi:hypothetical protein